MSEEVEAWHFVNASKTFRYDDKTKVVVGEKYCVNPEKLALCAFGLHASIRPIDAIEYAPGPIVCRVKLSGKIIHSDDKLVASERTVLWMADATNTLHEFACLCAEDVLPLFEAKYPDDKRPRLAIEAKRKWLRGEITDEGLAAAGGAARDAARDAARAVARGAAVDAAWYAAWAAARGAAGDAARGAAGDAAWYAARGAAGDAAGDAAWGAARDRQNQRLEEMLLRLKPVGVEVKDV